jgi:hypothetical protein
MQRPYDDGCMDICMFMTFFISVNLRAPLY